MGEKGLAQDNLYRLKYNATYSTTVSRYDQIARFSFQSRIQSNSLRNHLLVEYQCPLFLYILKTYLREIQCNLFDSKGLSVFTLLIKACKEGCLSDRQMEICDCREYRFPKDASKNERVCDVMNATVGMSSFFQSSSL